ncbi:sodium-coupled monocarboxylate transporter 1-like [Tenebrio molitor]|uniref:sodium-coupled monocarboxylate transporter 1-like n=1 Tax=Tenebrio molitor TaxID=7067 RepID=UPI0036248238
MTPVTQLFRWPDYVVLITTLALSLAIGLYFGCFRGFTNVEEYLMGNRKMDVFPITMSLVASYVSGISILGIPTDTYLYGISYLYSIIGLTITAVIMNRIFLPVFYNLKLTSAYEYLEMRFDKKVRIFGSILFGIYNMTWIAMVMYVSGLTLSQATGLNVHLITPMVCLICVLYTTLGGLKAVVWTDVIQATMMLLALILVLIKGTVDVGGFSTILERNYESGRIETPSLDFDPRSKYTLWSLSIGASVYFLMTTGIDQTMLQRYLSLSSLRSAKKTVWFFVLGYGVFVTLGCYCGILMYAAFYKCDPLLTQLAEKKNQLVPLFVMKILNEFPGFPGIFVAGILSASLSSLSTGLNSMAAVILEDFQKVYIRRSLSERMSSIIMKLSVVIFGTLCVGLVYIIEKLGAILQVYMSVGAVTNGTTLGLFTVGILLPWVNEKGALTGGISSLVFMGWLCFRAQAEIASGTLVYSQKPLTTEECQSNFTFVQQEGIMINLNTSGITQPEKNFEMYHVSYLWYTLMGTVIVIIVSLLVSFITKPLNPNEVNTNLLAPFLGTLVKSPIRSNESVIYNFPAIEEMEMVNEE